MDSRNLIDFGIQDMMLDTKMINYSSFDNHTELEPDFAETDYFTPLNAFINVIIYVVNFFVIYLFYVKKRRLLSCPSNQLLFSFFIMDVLGGLSITLQVILHTFADFFAQRPRLYTSYRVFADLFTSFLVSSVVMHLCGITLDRYMSLFYALHYRRIMTIKAAKRYIAVSWLLPLFISLLQLCWLYRVIDSDNKVDVSEIDIKYSFATFVLFLALPMIFLGAAFIRMFLEIKRLLNSPPDMNLNNQNRVSAKQRRVIYLFSSMYVCFLIFTLPYYLLRSYMDLERAWEDQEKLHKYLTYTEITYTLKNLTSVTSPLLYTGINRDTRALLVELCNTNFKKTRALFIDFCYLRIKKKQDGSSDTDVNMEGSLSSTHDPCIRTVTTKDISMELVVLRKDMGERNELM